MQKPLTTFKTLHSLMLSKFMKANEKEMWNSVDVQNIYSENGEYKLNRLSDLLKSAFGGVEKMLSGKNFPQNTRALRICVKEILR